MALNPSNSSNSEQLALKGLNINEHVACALCIRAVVVNKALSLPTIARVYDINQLPGKPTSDHQLQHHLVASHADDTLQHDAATVCC